MVRGDEENARINEEERREKGDFLHREQLRRAPRSGELRTVCRAGRRVGDKFCWAVLSPVAEFHI